MSLEFIVDGDDADISGRNVVLCSFFRVHFDGGPDLGRGNCECGDE